MSPSQLVNIFVYTTTYGSSGLEHSQAYGYLPSRQQWQLHRFFAPSKDLINSQLLEHRRSITAQFPSLPQQAGRALAQLNRVDQQVVTSARPGRNVSVVSAVVRPELDHRRLAKALLAWQLQQLQAERDDTDRAA